MLFRSIRAEDDNFVSAQKLLADFEINCHKFDKYPEVNVYQKYENYALAINNEEKNIKKIINNLLGKLFIGKDIKIIDSLLPQYTNLQRLESIKQKFIELGGSDRHIHTNAYDGALTPKQIVDLAISEGITQIVITDHDTIDGYFAAKEYIDTLDVPFSIQPAVELSLSYQYVTKDSVENTGVHVKVIIPYKELTWFKTNLVKLKNKNIEDIAPILKRKGCEVIIAHPYREFIDGIDDFTEFNMRQVNYLLEKLLREGYINGIEYHYSMHSSLHQEKLKEAIDKILFDEQATFLPFKENEELYAELAERKKHDRNLLEDIELQKYLREAKDYCDVGKVHFDGPNSDFHTNKNKTYEVVLGKGIVKGMESIGITGFSNIRYHDSFRLSRENITKKKIRNIQNMIDADLVDTDIISEILSTLEDNEFDLHIYDLLKSALLRLKNIE